MQKSKYRTRTGPNPPVAVGQLWMDEKTGKVRRVTSHDEWEVHFRSVETGVSTTVARVSRNGSPSRYRYVELVPEEVPPVHIRRRVGEPRETFCGQLVDNVEATATMGNLGWWKKRNREICHTCNTKAMDKNERVVEMAEGAQ